MFVKVNKKWQIVLDIFMIVLGTFIMGFAFSIFLEPNNISTGGFSGLSMIIKSLLEGIGITFLSSSIIYLILNIGLFIFAMKILGRMFAIKALIGICSFSLAMQVFTYVEFFQYETIISALYGGLLIGLGLGIVVRFGGSTGGSDMIACICKNKFERVSIGKVVAIVDIIVVVLSLFAFNNGLELLPYTILALFLSSNTADFVNEGYKQVKAYNIITDKPEEISEKIMTLLKRGCTVHQAKGMHYKQEKSVLVCLISKFQISELKTIIQEVDPNAFVYSTSVNEVMGQWTQPSEYANEKKSKRKNKELVDAEQKVEIQDEKTDN